MSMQPPPNLLDARRSTPARLLGAPGPSPAQIERMLSSAVRVPDHGRLTPWRFLLIESEARMRLGERLAQRFAEREPGAGEAALEKERARFSHAPSIIAVIARVAEPHRIPAQEQLLSAGCVCFALLLAAEAEGFGAQWLTGWAAYDDLIAAALGLAAGERVAGFIHIGSAVERVAERERPVVADLLERWNG